MITLIIIIYLAGCILMYGRFTASLQDVEWDFIYALPPHQKTITAIALIVSIFSWFGFILGIGVYYIFREKVFLSYSYKKLWAKYNESCTN